MIRPGLNERIGRIQMGVVAIARCGRRQTRRGGNFCRSKGQMLTSFVRNWEQRRRVLSDPGKDRGVDRLVDGWVAEWMVGRWSCGWVGGEVGRGKEYMWTGNIVL